MCHGHWHALVKSPDPRLPEPSYRWAVSRVWKSLSDFGIKNHDVCSTAILVAVLPPRGAGKIALLSHLDRVRLSGVFFIAAPLIPRRGPGADDANLVSSQSMNHKQECSPNRHSDDDEPFFVCRMVRIRNGDRARITDVNHRRAVSGPY